MEEKKHGILNIKNFKDMDKDQQKDIIKKVLYGLCAGTFALGMIFNAPAWLTGLTGLFTGMGLTNTVAKIKDKVNLRKPVEAAGMAR